MLLRRNLGVVFAIAALLAAAGFVFRSSVVAQVPEPTTPLQLERVDVLKKRVEIYEKLVQIATGTPEELIAAQNDLLDAELELAKNPNGRIALLQQKLDNAKRLEELAAKRKESARGNEADILLAKANRLAVEIEIGRQKR